MARDRQASPAGTRRLIAASVLLGAFVLFDIGLLGWLIFRSLSRREIEQVLLETRNEARELADQIAGSASAGDKDLYTVIAVERERQTYFDSILQKRDIVQRVEIRDKDGRLVFRAQAETFDPTEVDEPARLETREEPPRVEYKDVEKRETRDYDLNVPIGELGILHIGISQAQMQKRIEVLRWELLRQTGLIGAVTLAVLLFAYLTIWWLWRRGRKLEQQAAESERLAYIGTLASGLAHEIRNPLNSLSLNMQLLEEEACVQGAGDSRRLLSITQSELGRLERLVTDFLSYAKPRPLDLEEVPAAELLRACTEVVRGDLEARGATARIEDSTGGAAVLADREQIAQLLLNLVQNALAATEGSGREPEIRLSVERENGMIVLGVADNGTGISPEATSKIFDLFFSTRKGGTGLGLAVVQRIARDHGGAVDVGSTPDVGTRFSVRLPAAETTGQESPVRATLESAASRADAPV